MSQAQRSPIRVMEQLCAVLHAQGEVIHPHPTDKLAEIIKKAQAADMLTCDDDVCACAYPVHLEPDNPMVQYLPRDFWMAWVLSRSPKQAIEAANRLRSVAQTRTSMFVVLHVWPEVSGQLLAQGFHPLGTTYRCLVSDLQVASNPAIAVRDYTPEDIEVYVDLNTELTKTDYSFVPEVSHTGIDLRAFKRRYAEKMLSDYLAGVFSLKLAFYEDRPVGLIGYFVKREGKRLERPGAYVEIGGLVVTENARRIKVASTLVARMLTALAAQEDMPKIVFVSSITASPFANPFYRSIGFRPAWGTVIAPTP